jgi:hypothetical protein
MMNHVTLYAPQIHICTCVCMCVSQMCMCACMYVCIHCGMCVCDLPGIPYECHSVLEAANTDLHPCSNIQSSISAKTMH